MRSVNLLVRSVTLPVRSVNLLVRSVTLPVRSVNLLVRSVTLPVRSVTKLCGLLIKSIVLLMYALHGEDWKWL